MTAVRLIGFAINASMFLIVLALGLDATFGNLSYLFRKPGLLVRSILSMNIVMLALVILALLVFKLPPPVRIALVALAVSPVPPVLPGKQERAGGTANYVLGLLVASAIVAIVLVPLAVELLGRMFGIAMHMPPSRVAAIVFGSVVVPLLAGVAIRHFAPALSKRIMRPISVFAAVLLIVAVLPVLVIAAKTLWALVGNGTIIFLVLFPLIGIGVGHLLGGPNSDDRTVLALASGTRHPGIAIAFASINFPEERAVIAVVLYHLVVGALVSFPYVNWRKHGHAAGMEKLGHRDVPVP